MNDAYLPRMEQGNQFPPEEPLIRELLVREIIHATRWVAIVEVWQALLKVEREAKSLREEHEKLHPLNTPMSDKV